MAPTTQLTTTCHRKKRLANLEHCSAVKKRQLQNLWDASDFYHHSPSCYKITAKILAFCTSLPLVKIRSIASMISSSSLCMSWVWLLCCDALTVNHHPVNKLHEWCYPCTLTPHLLHILKQMLHQIWQNIHRMAILISWEGFECNLLQKYFSFTISTFFLNISKNFS